ncbi:MAG: DUF4190 domain-containing protein [Solobacterium sp.]|jgi:hypothetical protein|nr:DUF4190 domain-containing protein [Solobacterium sp.]
MDYQSISSEYADLYIKKDILLVNTADSEYQIPLRTISKISFKKAGDEEHPGSIQCFMVDGTSVSAPFEKDMEPVFHDAYAKIAERLSELQEETPAAGSKPKHSGNGLAIASLVMGIIALVTSIIPIINNMSFLLGIVGLIFAVIALVKKAPKGKSIAGAVLCVLAMVFALSLQNTWSKDLSDASGDHTADILKNDLSVQMGSFTCTSDQYGLTTTELPLTLTNLTSESKSFSVHVEALDSNGNRIVDDTVYASSLGAGQSVDEKLFQYVESDKLDAVKAATFNIVEVSMY